MGKVKKASKEIPAQFKLGFWSSVIFLTIFGLGVWKLIEILIKYFK